MELNKFSILAKAVNVIGRASTAAQVEMALTYLTNALEFCKSRGLFHSNVEHQMWEKHLMNELNETAKRVVKGDNNDT
jgi:hypothetical protein